MSIDKSKEENKIDPRSTRLVCAKLYEGGLLCSYKILSSIKRKPFKGKSPEFELDIDKITNEAEAAFKYHTKFALIAVVLSFLAFILYIYSDESFGLTQLIFGEFGFEQFMFYVFSISAICLLLLKPVRDRNIAFENFSKTSFNSKNKKSIFPETQNGTESILTKFCDWTTRNNIKPEEDDGNRQNVIIFGDYFPFLGAGRRIRNWNFVTDLSKPKNKEDKENKIGELSVRELYKVAYNRIEEKKLPNLSYEYILFADGNEEDELADGNEEDEPNFLLKDRSKPCTYLKKIKVITDQLKNKSGESAQPESTESCFEICKDGVFKNCRTYLNISHHDKNRSTLFSAFLRFSKIEKELFAECSFYVLTPINENIYNVDKLPKNNSFFAVKSIFVTVSLIVVYILFSGSVIPAFVLFILTALPLVSILNSRAKEREYNTNLEQIKEEPHNYGLLKTFRETIASPDYKNYFSAQDLIFIQNTLENAIIDSVADLLDEKKIDSSFLRNEMVSYVNNGTTLFGGKMENNYSQNITGNRNIVNEMKQAVQKVMD